MLIALLLGGAVVLEIKRLHDRGKHEELLQEYQEQTDVLNQEKKIAEEKLQEVHAACQQQADELEQLRGRSQQLQTTIAAVEERCNVVLEQNETLSDTAAELAAQHAQAKLQAEQLQLQNDDLHKQMDSMQSFHRKMVDHAAKAARDELSKHVAACVKDLAAGAMTAREFVDALHAVGCDVDMTADELAALEPIRKKNGAALELRVEDSWNKPGFGLSMPSPQRCADRLRTMLSIKSDSDDVSATSSPSLMPPHSPLPISLHSPSSVLAWERSHSLQGSTDNNRRSPAAAAAVARVQPQTIDGSALQSAASTPASLSSPSISSAPEASPAVAAGVDVHSSSTVQPQRTAAGLQFSRSSSQARVGVVPSFSLLRQPQASASSTASTSRAQTWLHDAREHGDVATAPPVAAQLLSDSDGASDDRHVIATT